MFTKSLNRILSLSSVYRHLVYQLHAGAIFKSLEEFSVA